MLFHGHAKQVSNDTCVGCDLQLAFRMDDNRFSERVLDSVDALDVVLRASERSTVNVLSLLPAKTSFSPAVKSTCYGLRTVLIILFLLNVRGSTQTSDTRFGVRIGFQSCNISRNLLVCCFPR